MLNRASRAAPGRVRARRRLRAVRFGLKAEAHTWRRRSLRREAPLPFGRGIILVRDPFPAKIPLPDR